MLMHITSFLHRLRHETRDVASLRSFMAALGALIGCWRRNDVHARSLTVLPVVVVTRTQRSTRMDKPTKGLPM